MYFFEKRKKCALDLKTKRLGYIRVSSHCEWLPSDKLAKHDYHAKRKKHTTNFLISAPEIHLSVMLLNNYLSGILKNI